jgi:hypothetical protein
MGQAIDRLGGCQAEIHSTLEWPIPFIEQRGILKPREGRMTP